MPDLHTRDAQRMLDYASRNGSDRDALTGVGYAILALAEAVRAASPPPKKSLGRKIRNAFSPRSGRSE